MRRAMQWVNHAMTQINGLSLGFIIIFILVDIVGRLISKPVSGASELAIFSMVITVYLGVSYCEETGSHVNVEAISMRLSQRKRIILSIFIYLLSLGILGVIVYSTWLFAYSSFVSNHAIPGTRPIKIYPVTFAIFLGFVAYFFQCLVNLIAEVRKLSGTTGKGL